MLQTTHVVCPRQKRTVATSAEYWSFCSSSAPSSPLCLAAGLSGKRRCGPQPCSASCVDSPGLLRTPLQPPRGSGRFAQGHWDLVRGQQCVSHGGFRSTCTEATGGDRVRE